MLVVFCLIFAPFLCAWCVLGFCVCLCVVLSPALPLEATGGLGRWSSGQHTCSSSAVISTRIYIQTNLPDPAGSLNQSQWENASRTWTCSCVFETSAYLFSVSPQTTKPEPELDRYHPSILCHFVVYDVEKITCKCHVNLTMFVHTANGWE